MDKPKLIIIESIQGGGKTTITDYIRNNMQHVTLMRLNGIADTSEEGARKMLINHKCILESIAMTRGCDMSYVLDRSHISQKVYSNLGYANYDFKRETDVLNQHLDILGNYYDVYFILLTVDEKDLEKRLKRNKCEVEYSKFSIENSMNQLREYKKELKHLSDTTKNVRCFQIENKELDITINSIMEIILQNMLDGKGGK